MSHPLKIWTVMLAATVASLMLGAFLLVEPVALAVGRGLEERFSSDPALRPDPFGIIVLGGDLGYYRDGQGAIIMKSSRIATAIALAARYPTAQIVLSGAFGEAEDGRKMLIQAGITPARIVTEVQSKTTWENAIFTRARIEPDPGRLWFLVTSAVHLPRAVGAFRRVGFHVMGVAADRTTSPDSLARIARGEAFALFAYWMTGRSAAIFPGPEI